MILLIDILNIYCIRIHNNIIKDSLVGTIRHFKSKHHHHRRQNPQLKVVEVSTALADVGIVRYQLWTSAGITI